MKTMVSTAGTGVPSAPESADVLVPGAKAGPWVVERELGRGGMGAVYAVVHEEIGKRAALKVVHRRLMPSFNCDRMLLEAKVVNQVGHPNIVDIFETGTLGDGRPYIVMERLSGASLAVRADDGKLLPDFVIAVLLQICDALIAAHAAGIVHRDLKLDNVFLVDNPDEPALPKVKLLDWGIAKVIHAEVKHTIEGQLMGTPQYLAPEQARGLAVSPETDVYSLGVMAYELFLEQLPFEAETAAEVMALHLRATPPPPRELWPDIPPELEDLLLAMLAKAPERRPTMADVAQRLEIVRSELERRCQVRGRRPSTATRRPSTPSRPGRPISGPSSGPGLAPTELYGWRSETRRWQYALGGLAIALSGLLFWISRAGDHGVVAAAAQSAALVAPAGPGAAPRRAARPIPEAVTETGAEAMTGAAPSGDPEPAALRTAELTDSDSVDLRPAIAVSESTVGPRRGDARPAAHSPTQRAVSRPAPARSPAAPRLRVKLDPDGTLDVYR